MPTKTVERPAFPCLACIREEGRPDNDWFTELARVVLLGNVTSAEVWLLLRKRDGQYGHQLFNRIGDYFEGHACPDEKIRLTAEALHQYGVPRAEDQHTCGK